MTKQFQRRLSTFSEYLECDLPQCLDLREKSISMISFFSFFSFVSVNILKPWIINE